MNKKQSSEACRLPSLRLVFTRNTSAEIAETSVDSKTSRCSRWFAADAGRSHVTEAYTATGDSSTLVFATSTSAGTADTSFDSNKVVEMFTGGSPHTTRGMCSVFKEYRSHKGTRTLQICSQADLPPLHRVREVAILPHTLFW